MDSIQDKFNDGFNSFKHKRRMLAVLISFISILWGIDKEQAYYLKDEEIGKIQKTLEHIKSESDTLTSNHLFNEKYFQYYQQHSDISEKEINDFLVFLNNYLRETMELEESANLTLEQYKDLNMIEKVIRSIIETLNDSLRRDTKSLTIGEVKGIETIFYPLTSSAYELQKAFEDLRQTNNTQRALNILLYISAISLSITASELTIHRKRKRDEAFKAKIESRLDTAHQQLRSRTIDGEGEILLGALDIYSGNKPE